MPKPDFFVVGAPKCGTTAMCEYLSKHPQVFIPYMKEIHFFGSDLRRRRVVNNLDDYLALFYDSEGCVCGEGSVWYLYSKHAAHEIYSFNPNAKIVVMLRNPVEFVYSLHSALVFSGDEPIEDFSKALDAEKDRKQGRRLPKLNRQPEALLYTEAAQFATQLQRYFDVFPREQIHVIIYDDFKQDTSSCYRNLLAFLDVDPSFKTDFKVVNPAKVVRFKLLRYLKQHPPKLLRTIGRALVPARVRYRINKKFFRLNSRPQQRQPMDSLLQQQLKTQFTPQVEQLSTMLNRDLSHWIH